MSDKITIIRAPHDHINPYFMMRRDTAQDRTLSYEAAGVLAYLLSKPVDWRVQPTDLQREKIGENGAGCGRDKVYRILRELVDKGYAQRVAIREGGKFTAFEYHVFEAPLTEIPYTVEPDAEKPTLQKKERKKKQTSATAGAGRPRNPFYDAIQAVWGYTGSLNGETQKMLCGSSKRAGYREANITPAMTPEELLAWAAYYRATKLHGDPNLNMVENRLKIADSVAQWRAAGSPAATVGETEDDRERQALTNATAAELSAIPTFGGQS